MKKRLRKRPGGPPRIVYQLAPELIAFAQANVCSQLGLDLETFKKLPDAEQKRLGKDVLKNWK